MRKDFELDIDQKSQWKIFTVNSMQERLPFIIEECGLFHTKSEFFTEGEDINNYILIYTISGNGYCKYRDNRQILKPESVILIHCMEHFFVKPLEDEWSYYWVHFRGESVEDYMEFLMGERADAFQIRDGRELIRNFEQLLSYQMLLDVRLSFCASNHISNILNSLIVNKEADERQSVDAAVSENAKKIIDYIEMNYMQDIMIEDLQKVVNLSRYYMIRSFKKAKGITPYEYLINYRISMGKMMLRTTEKPIEQIAEEVGFPSVNNFIIQFKKHVGTTPGKYRRSQTYVGKV